MYTKMMVGDKTSLLPDVNNVSNKSKRFYKMIA